MKRSRRGRWAKRSALLLVGGGVVNVVVAWGCALWSPVWSVRTSPSRLHHLAEVYAVLPDGPPISRLSGDTPVSSIRYRASYVDVVEESGVGVSRVLIRERWVSVSKRTGAPAVPETRTALLAGWPLYAMAADPRGVLEEHATDQSGLWSWALPVPDRLGAVEQPGRVWFWKSGTVIDRVIPLRPIGRGFLLGACFYAGVLAALWWVFASLRELGRLERGLCGACACVVGTLPTCPECGTPTPLARSRGGRQL